MKYSDELCDWLVEAGYTHCFYVAGGNIMHLLNSARTRFKCIPVIHEVAAGVATEYFNELRTPDQGRAFALVTAGPGVTNIVTAIAGAFAESRELLILGGQVKTTDLSRGTLRQKGIQEIDGVELVKSITKLSKLYDRRFSKQVFLQDIIIGETPRKGPVFIEVCLDIQGSSHFGIYVDDPKIKTEKTPDSTDSLQHETILNAIRTSIRPIILIGGGVSRDRAVELIKFAELNSIPIQTTWNGADRIAHDHHLYWGRPNTWGQRYANILLQQCDLLIAIGTRLGLQQTGFNWQEFVPLGSIIHVDIDANELNKIHPETRYKLQVRSEDFIDKVSKLDLKRDKSVLAEWLNFGNLVRNTLPLSEPFNQPRETYINTYDFIQWLSKHVKSGDIFIPSSSGSAETVSMQSFQQSKGVLIATSKGMASMGYGLSGAIGAAFIGKERVFHIEGDGGLAQNLQEFGTVKANNLPIKTFIFDNDGYASIRTTQRIYFEGEYMGCDIATGLGLPVWEKIAAAYGIRFIQLHASHLNDPSVLSALYDENPTIFLVPVDPEQTYYPKISSSVDSSTGELKSNPLHKMSPDLPEETWKIVAKYLIKEF